MRDKDKNTFLKLEDQFGDLAAQAYLYSEIFMGWETIALRRKFRQLQQLAEQIVSEIQSILEYHGVMEIGEGGGAEEGGGELN